MIKNIPNVPLYHSERFVTFSPSERLVAFQRRHKNDKHGAVIVAEVEGDGALVLPNANADYAWIEAITWLDEDRLLVSYANEDDKLWTLPTQRARTINDDNFPSQYIPTARGLAACTSSAFSEKSLEIFSCEDLTRVAHFPIKGLFDRSTPPSLQISSDGLVAVLTNPAQSIVVVTEHGAPWKISGTRDNFEFAWLSPSGKWLIIKRKDPRAEIWDICAQTLRTTLPDVSYARFSFSRDETTLMLLGGDTVRVATLDGELRTVLNGAACIRRAAPISALSMTTGGDLVVSRDTRQFERKRGTVFRDARTAGRAVLSPDGGHALVFSEHGAKVVELRLL